MNGNVFNDTKKEYIKELQEVKKLLQFLILFSDLGNAEVNVIFTESDKIRNINKEHRNIDKETDVISFALEESKVDTYLDYRVLGDIYISPDAALKQCAEFNNDLTEELKFLTVHGFLHLLGYDHMNDKDTKKMFDRQEMLLDEYKK